MGRRNSGMRNRRSLLSLVLITLSLFLYACGKNETQNTDFEAVNTDMEETSESNPETNEDTNNGSDTMVIYFSATGTTKGVAEKIAALANADLYEIVPLEPYSEDDLDWNDKDSRTTIEQNDPAARPAVEGEFPSLDKYQTVFLGYPIWHGQAPKIISTFLENVDLSGKRIIPFCTSASSPIGTSAENLHSLSPDSEWNEGRRFSSSVSQEDLQEWIDGFQSDAEKGENKVMFMKIDDTEVDVIWEDNASVQELKALAEEKLIIPMSMYGGFEQVGSIGREITSNNSEITTAPGEIVLYSGSQLVVFYGSNS